MFYIRNPLLFQFVISTLFFISIFFYHALYIKGALLCQPLNEIQWQIDVLLFKKKTMVLNDSIFSTFENFKQYVDQTSIYQSRESYLRHLEFTDLQKLDNNRANQLYVLRYLTIMEYSFATKQRDIFVGDYLSHESQLALRGLSQRIIESTDDNSFWILIEDLAFIGRHTEDPLTQHYVAYVSSLNPFYLNITFDHQIYQEYLSYCKNDLPLKQ